MTGQLTDIIFPCKGRAQFTAASLTALVGNTDMRLVRLCVYTDGERISPSITEILGRYAPHRAVIQSEVGGPVGAMLHYLLQPGSEIFGKIDNDTIVPRWWRAKALRVMESNPDLGLLGIEPPMSRTPAPWMNGVAPPIPENLLREQAEVLGYAPCEAIGGIGLMRRSAFDRIDQMRPHSTYGGFTDWQIRHPEVRKGWIYPPLKVFLLDRLPIQPWCDLSRRYITNGEQRPWTNYPLSSKDLWAWWQKGRV